MRTLHIWGRLGDLPSIDPECIAALGCVIRNGSLDEWRVVTEHDPSLSPNGDFPALSDGEQRVAGYQAILGSLAAFKTTEEANFGEQEESDMISWTYFIQHRGQALLDLYLYVSSNNFWETTSPAFTKILPWYANYVIPPARRKVATSRTAHLGLRSLDLDSVKDAPGEENGTAFKSDNAATSFATQNSPEQMLNRQKSIHWLRIQSHSDTFRLHQLTSEFFEPLEKLLGNEKYLITKKDPTGLDYLALGYLSLMLYTPVPQQWLADALKTRYPKLKAYTDRMYKHTFKSTDLKWTEQLYEASPPTTSEGIRFIGQGLLGWALVWKTPISVDPSYSRPSSPEPSGLSFQTLAWSAALIGGMAFVATKMIAGTPTSDSDISIHETEYLQPTKLSDFGEAGAALAVLDQQMDLKTRERGRVGGVTIMEVDVENESGEVGRQVVVSK
ncbi:Mitochondrial outer membrane translocase complex Tom37/Metaxin [Venturia nashicola]|nr:Mitochondrial outer membrane translocase complex Tom37/Metaxin [Venturia nashicola]